MGNDVAKAGGFSNSAPRQVRRAVAIREAADPLGPLLAPVHALRGVGPSLGARLGRLLRVPEARCLDLLWHLPHDLIERRLQTRPAALVEGERITLLVHVQQHQPGAAPIRRLRSSSSVTSRRCPDTSTGSARQVTAFGKRF